MKREAARIKVQTKFSGFQHQYSFYKTEKFESFFMKRKACFIDWWKLYDRSMIWSIISKLFWTSPFRESLMAAWGIHSLSLTMSQPLPPVWKRDQGYEHSCILLGNRTEHAVQEKMWVAWCSAGPLPNRNDLPPLVSGITATLLQSLVFQQPVSHARKQTHVFLMFPTWGKMDRLEAEQVNPSKMRFAMGLRNG